MASLQCIHLQVEQGFTPCVSAGPRKVTFAELRSCYHWNRAESCFSRRVCVRKEDRLQFLPRPDDVLFRKRLNLSATRAKDGDSSDEKRAKRAREKVETTTSDLRSKITQFVRSKSGLSWLLGPAVVTTAIVIPGAIVNLPSLFQRNFLGGLMATFGLDILSVFSIDLFLILADKYGHHQLVSGGPPPWIGPWEYTGYPEGYPKLLNYVSYIGVGIAILAILASVIVAKLPAALATFGPYLALIFAQVAYERLVGNDRVPVFPLVPIVFTVYRFHQLNRGLRLLSVITGGSALLSSFVHVSASLWAMYLGMHLTQLPWLYSTWNSNRAT